MAKPSEDRATQRALREKVLGLGEKSVRKTFYPELQKRLAELARLGAAVDQSPINVLILDTEYRVLYVNRAYEATSGYTREQIIGKEAPFISHRVNATPSYQEMWSALLRGEYWRGRLVRNRDDGTALTHEVIAAPVRNEAGVVVNYLFTGRDVGREIELEGQLRQAQKMEAIGQLAGGVAHDFNNLLQVITGYAKVVQETIQQTEAGRLVREELDTVLKAAQRATALVRQLLAFSRRQVLQLVELRLNEVVDDLAKMVRRVIGEHIVLTVRSTPNTGFIRADRGQIEQILMNLCVNARDAMPNGGEITIETTDLVLDEDYCLTHTWARPGPYVALVVSDTGSGMDEETMAHIFEPFFTTKPEGQGTGLGLSTVYGIVQQHSGMISVDSKPGVGTTFRIYFPAVEATATRVEVKAHPVKGGTETILMAEDDEQIRCLSKRFLDAAGYTVYTAANGQEALREFEACASRVDLLLLDVAMPELGGVAVFERIRRDWPQMRVLFTSGYLGEDPNGDWAFRDGAPLLQKPYQREELLKKVREVLDA